jgi:hypothetical protein
MATAGAAIASSRVAAEAIAVEAVLRLLGGIMVVDRLYAPADLECVVAAGRFTAAQQFPMLEDRGPAQVAPMLPTPAHRVATVAADMLAANRMAVVVDMPAAANTGNV